MNYVKNILRTILIGLAVMLITQIALAQGSEYVMFWSQATALI